MFIEESPDGVTIWHGEVVDVAWSGQAFGNLAMTYDTDGTALERQRRLAAVAGAGRLTVMVAVHGVNIQNLCGVPLEQIKPEYNVDGIIFDQDELGAGLWPADCCGLVLAGTTHDNRPIAGLFHIGLKGADRGVHLLGAEALMAQGVQRDAIEPFLGPSIHAESYVYTDLPPALRSERWQGYIEAQEDGYHINVRQLVIDELVAAGLSFGQDHIHPDDTGDPASGWFSHARSYRARVDEHPETDPEGRNGVIVTLARKSS